MESLEPKPGVSIRSVCNDLMGGAKSAGEQIPRVLASSIPLSLALTLLQRSGIGSILISAGLDACRNFGWKGVFVVGHPEFYPRFGFVPAAPLGLHYKGAEFDPYLFVREISPGALQGISGMIRYYSAFDEV